MPPPPGLPDASRNMLDDVALQMSAPLVRDWVLRCMSAAGSMERGATVPFTLELPPEDVSLYEQFGLYELRGGPMELLMDVELRTDMFLKPSWDNQALSRVKRLGDVWNVMEWRSTEQAQKFQPFQTLRPDLVYLAEQRFGFVKERFLGGRTLYRCLRCCRRTCRKVVVGEFTESRWWSLVCWKLMLQLSFL